MCGGDPAVGERGREGGAQGKSSSQQPDGASTFCQFQCRKKTHINILTREMHHNTLSRNTRPGCCVERPPGYPVEMQYLFVLCVAATGGTPSTLTLTLRNTRPGCCVGSLAGVVWRCNTAVVCGSRGRYTLHTHNTQHFTATTLGRFEK